MDRRLAVVALALAVGVVLGGGGARAEGRGEVDASLHVFVQPSSSTALLVGTPTVSGHGDVLPWLRVDASWLLDAVTGATPRTYTRPDAISTATQFSEVRNVLGVGLTATAGPLAFEAGYSYGTESDYRTHLVRGGVRLDTFNHNTVVRLAYAHSFDSICDLAQAGVPLTLRQPLDASKGCFAGTPGLTEESLDTDGVELSLTQVLTPRLLASLVGAYEHFAGFQSSPYRRVELDGGLMLAQESHPRVRDRGSVTARLRLAVPRLRATVGVDLRLYRDSWGVQSATLEAQWEQPIGSSSWRYGVRARGYLQSGAVFFRDQGSADSYAALGPVGQYFTADQELAPLADLLVGLRFVHGGRRPPDDRYFWLFDTLDTTLSVDYLKQFALTPDPPNNARIAAFASALVLSLSWLGRF